jgi:hypothetical protein
MVVIIDAEALLPAQEVPRSTDSESLGGKRPKIVEYRPPATLLGAAACADFASDWRWLSCCKNDVPAFR